MAQPGSRYSPVRPLTPDERALLFYYCLNHTVTRCLICARSYFLSELVADLLSGRTHLCPQCRRDLTENVRTHVYACGIMPDEVRQKAQALREMAQHLVKESRQLRDKVLFGSDFPVITPDRWLAAFADLDLDDDVRRGILKDNAVRVLGLA